MQERALQKTAAGLLPNRMTIQVTRRHDGWEAQIMEEPATLTSARDAHGAVGGAFSVLADLIVGDVLASMIHGRQC